MRILIVEDDFVSRNLMHRILEKHGACDVAIDGREAVNAFKMALDEGEPYDLVCMDIMMPNLDGHSAVKEIRAIEEGRGVAPVDEVKVFMTTALGDTRNVSDAFFHGHVSGYIVKPIKPSMLLGELKNAGLLPDEG